MTENSTKTLHELKKLAKHITFAARRRASLYRLSHEDNPLLRHVYISVSEALSNSVSSEERFWIERIEHLRASMNSSTEEFTRIDFGAGTRKSKRSQQEMETGVKVHDTLGTISRRLSKPAFWCLVLFKLVRTMRPESCVEMGTAVGISASYQAAALKLNKRGSLVTLEGASTLAEIATTNFRTLGLNNLKLIIGRFQDTLSSVLERQQPVDYVFVDGHHDEQATLQYWHEIMPFLAKQAVLVLDDIRWSSGMKRAWKTIAHDASISAAVDLGTIGLCVVDESIHQRKYFSLPLW